MQDSPSPALRLLVTNTAIFISLDAAVMLCVIVGDVGAATDTGGALVCTNVAAHVVTLIIGTLHVVVTDNLALRMCGVGGTVFGTLVITCLGSQHRCASAAGAVRISIAYAGIPGLDAAVGGTVLAQGDVAAVAGVVLVHTHIAAFVLSVRVTLLGAGVPVFTLAFTFHPTILGRTVADFLSLSVGGVGWTVLRTLVITCL